MPLLRVEQFLALERHLSRFSVCRHYAKLFRHVGPFALGHAKSSEATSRCRKTNHSGHGGAAPRSGTIMKRYYCQGTAMVSIATMLTYMTAAAFAEEPVAE